MAAQIIAFPSRPANDVGEPIKRSPELLLLLAIMKALPTTMREITYRQVELVARMSGDDAALNALRIVKALS